MDRQTSDLNRSFKLTVLNSGISRFGLSAFNLMIIWVILYETKNAFLAGLGDGILSLPLFLSFLVGAYVDRTRSKKELAVAAGLVRAFFLSSILFGFYLHNVIVILLSIYSSGFILGFTSDVLNSIRASWTKEFLTREQYKHGSSVQSVAVSVAEGIGYLSSGIFLAFGFYNSFLVILLVFLISILPVIFVRSSAKPEVKSTTDSAREGLNFIRGSKPVWQMMSIALIVNMMFGMGGIIFISLVQLKLHLQSYYASVIFSALIGGMIFGSFIAPKLKGKLGNISLIMFVVMGFLTVSIAFIDNVFIILVPVVLIGIIMGILNVLLSSALLKIVPRELMGRVSGAFNTFSLATTFFSGMVGGAIIELTSVSFSLIIVGAGVLLSTPMWIIFRELYSITL
jgi:DHA3 family macrolide efflux protein-like MFS transporter